MAIPASLARSRTLSPPGHRTRRSAFCRDLMGAQVVDHQTARPELGDLRAATRLTDAAADRAESAIRSLTFRNAGRAALQPLVAASTRYPPICIPTSCPMLSAVAHRSDDRGSRKRRSALYKAAEAVFLWCRTLPGSV